MFNQRITKLFIHIWKVLFGLCSLYVVFLCSVSVNAQEKAVVDLYTDADHIVNLNKSNLHTKFLGKQNTFVVEFYNSWCGYCIGYAPVWKKFAEDVKGWKKVGQVAAINCAQVENTEICRAYKIIKYPSLRTFWTNVQSNDLGTEGEGLFVVSGLREQWLDFISSHWKDGVPNHWPSLEPTKSISLRDIWTNIPKSVNSVILIIEKDDSYIGREVILDLSGYNLTILRALDSNLELMSDLKMKIEFDSLPSMFLLENSDDVKLLSSTSKEPREHFRRIIQTKFLGINDLLEVKVPMTSTTRSPKKVFLTPTSVFMVDLENTLHYAIKQEFVLQELIQEERLEALQNFMEILNYVFPGREPVKRFLHGLYIYLSKRRTGRVTATEILGVIDNLQTDSSFLPPMDEWKECRGSTEKYRGFPCGLWTLFHVLTVEAYQQYKKGNDDLGPPERTLLPIRDYVLNIFSCSECAKNFRVESASMLKEARFPNETVLWLWKTHNRVNKRLAGQESEDPQHPKIQYPPVEICDSCHLPASTPENPLWNETATLQFLLDHFSSIKRTDDDNNRLSRTAQAVDTFVGVNSEPRINERNSVDYHFQH